MCFCAFVCLFCKHLFLFFFFSSWCRGLATTCDCGIPLTLLLTFVLFHVFIVVDIYLFSITALQVYKHTNTTWTTVYLKQLWTW